MENSDENFQKPDILNDRGISSKDFEKYLVQDNSGIPMTSEELLMSQAHFINLQELMEVIDIWSYKESYTGSNDYVALLIKINDKKLSNMLYDGCQYVLQVWKNKERIYQQGHLGPVINMATSKTEIAYVTCTDEELDFCKPMNPSPYINVLRLYKRKMLRVPNPIIQQQLVDNRYPLTLFINSELLYVAQGKNLFGIKLDSFFKEFLDETISSFVDVSDQIQPPSSYSINTVYHEEDEESSQMFKERKRVAFINKKMIGKTLSNAIPSSKDNLRQNYTQNYGTNYGSIFQVKLPEERAVLWIQAEIKQSMNIKLYMVDLKQDNQSIVISTYDGSSIEDEKTLFVEQISDEIKYLHVTNLPQRGETLLSIMSRSGSWVVYNSQYEPVVSQNLIIDFFTSQTLESTQAKFIRAGYEGIYINLQENNRSLKFKFDEIQDKVTVKYCLNFDTFLFQQSFTECFMSERFIRLNIELFADLKMINSTIALVHSGRAVSFLDLSSQPRKWTHYMNDDFSLEDGKRDFAESRKTMNDDSDSKYFGHPAHEIKEIHLFGVTQHSNTMRVLIVQRDKILRQIIYFPEKRTIKQVLMKQTALDSGFQLGRVVSHFDSHGCNTTGNCNSGIYYEARQKNGPMDIYTSTITNQFRLLAQGLDPQLQIVRVQGAPHSLLFLANNSSNILKILNISPNQGICDQNGLMLCLQEEYQNFQHRPYAKYYLSNDYLIWIENGNLECLSIPLKKKITLDFQNNLTQIWGEEFGLYAKNKQEQVFFVRDELLLKFDDDGENKLRVFDDNTFQVMWKPLFNKDSQEQIFSNFEADPVSQRVTTFISSTQLVILGRLGSTFKSFDNSHSFSQRVLAFNVIEDSKSQSDFNSKICGLVPEFNKIVTWSVGTGKIIGSTWIEEDFQGLKFHTYWDGYSLLYTQKGSSSQQLTWRKIKVHEDKVEIVAEFKHNLDFSQGNKLYLNDANDLLLEFREYSFVFYSITKFGLSSKPFKIYNKFTNPIYFSPSFRTFFNVCSLGLTIILYTMNESQDQFEIIQKNWESPLKVMNIPIEGNLLSDSPPEKSNKKLLLQLISDKEVRLVNTYGIEQVIEIDTLKVTSERIFLKGEQFDGRGRNCYYQAKIIRAMQEIEMLDFLQTQQEGSCSRSQKIGAALVINGNLQIMQGVNFYEWRMLEYLVQDQIDITKIQDIEKLIKISLPNGNTFLHMLTNKNSKNLVKLLDIVQERGIEIKICPDFSGQTPLHYCIRDSNILVANKLLLVLAKYPLCDASDHIKDIMSDLMTMCPNAFSAYLDSRFVEVPWTPQFSKGSLKTITMQDFSVGQLNLCPTNQAQFDEKFFEANPDGTTQQRSPVKILISDIPELHLLSNEVGQKILLQLIQTDTSQQTMFRSQYIQAMIESQWEILEPQVRVKSLYPYIAYMILFNYYVCYVVKQKSSTLMNFVRYLTEIALIFLIAKDFKVRFQPKLRDKAFMYNIWFFLQVIPKTLVIISIMLHYIFGSEGFLVNIFATAIFFSWIGLMAFLRLNRGTGYLVRLIIEVIVDMSFFIVVMLVHLLAFTATFYVLEFQQQSDDLQLSQDPNADDTNSIVNLGLAFLSSASFTFQLLLGQFDTSTFNQETLGFSWFFFIAATVLLIIVMLNLLISIISNTFTRVSSQSNEMMYGEFARLIYENFHHHNHGPVDESSQRYLYIARMDDQRNILKGGVNPVESQQNEQLVKMVKEVATRQEQIENRILAQLSKMQEQIQHITKKEKASE